MVIVQKKSGEREEFNVQKLEHSLKKAGASSIMINKVIKKVEKILYDGIGTKEIYEKAFKWLKQQDYVSASRYDLKGALLRLGKKGYIFEKYIALLMQKQKYKTETNVVLQGECVSHEIDVLAQKNGKITLVECKHHMKPWTQLHIQTALYLYARFLDLKEDIDKVMLVTNTKVSYQAIHYCQCKDIGVLAWKYPKEKD